MKRGKARKKQLDIELIVIGAIPFVLAFVLGVAGAVFGARPEYYADPDTYGLEGFCNGFMRFAEKFWPLFIAGAWLIFIGIYTSVSGNKKK